MTERMARFIAVARGIRLCSNTYAVEYDRQEKRHVEPRMYLKLVRARQSSIVQVPVS